MKVTILGPTAAHLKKLRKDWNDWLTPTSKARSRRSATRRAATRSRLGTSDLRSACCWRFKLQAESFGDPDSVTPPNLASLTLLVEEGGQTILLTGDARGDQIVDGLKATGRLTGATVHGRRAEGAAPRLGEQHRLGVLRRRHRRALRLLRQRRAREPEPRRRRDDGQAPARGGGAGNFKFWFNSSEAVSETAKAIEHMVQAQKLVK